MVRKNAKIYLGGGGELKSEYTLSIPIEWPKSKPNNKNWLRGPKNEEKGDFLKMQEKNIPWNRFFSYLTLDMFI